jgi:hypothetical protein
MLFDHFYIYMFVYAFIIFNDYFQNLEMNMLVKISYFTVFGKIPQNMPFEKHMKVNMSTNVDQHDF